MRWRLWFDNVRDAPDEGWEVARTIQQAILMCEQFGLPQEMSLDHDMGWTWGDGSKIDLSEMVMKGQILNPDGTEPDDIREAPDGAVFATWWASEAAKEGFTLPEGFKYYIHSSNRVGAKDMSDLLTESFGFPPSGMYKWYELDEKQAQESHLSALRGVKLTYADGLVQSLRGHDAQKWLEMVNAPLILQQARNPGSVPAPMFKWTYTKTGD